VEDLERVGVEFVFSGPALELERAVVTLA